MTRLVLNIRLILCLHCFSRLHRAVSTKNFIWRKIFCRNPAADSGTRPARLAGSGGQAASALDLSARNQCRQIAGPLRQGSLGICLLDAGLPTRAACSRRTGRPSKRGRVGAGLFRDKRRWQNGMQSNLSSLSVLFVDFRHAGKCCAEFFKFAVRDALLNARCLIQSPEETLTVAGAKLDWHS
jgi:hypothetical protein